MNIKDYVKKLKNENIQVLGPSINYIKNRKELVIELEKETEFLNPSYKEVSINQRFYHLFFNSLEIEKCDFCQSPKRFSIYDRFSPDINKSNSNYYNNCGSLECEIKDFKLKGGSGKGYGGLIGKISSSPSLKNQLLEKTLFLNELYDQISDSQRFYHVFFEKHKIEKCHCGNPKKFSPLNKFSSDINPKKGSNYNETCNSVKCISEITATHTKEGIEKKYGVSNIWEIPGYRERIEKTNIKKYGTPYVMGSNAFKEKAKEKIKKDWGGNHPTKFKSVQDKKRKTNLEKYGYGCSLQNPKIYDKNIKSCYSSKNYILPSGKNIKLQGYEPWAMDILLKSFNEDDLYSDKEKIIELTGNFEYSILDKTCFYFPDIYIKSENKVIEVKSTYTYGLNDEKNKLKKKSVIDKDINFEFWVFDNNKNLYLF
jgi:hypothetical protein